VPRRELGHYSPMLELFTALAGALRAGLSIWEHDKKTELERELDEIETAFREEYNRKPRDNAILDGLELRLCQLSRRFTAEVGAQKVGVLPK
jgi:hypothetical protein